MTYAVDIEKKRIIFLNFSDFVRHTSVFIRTASAVRAIYCRDSNIIEHWILV